MAPGLVDVVAITIRMDLAQRSGRLHVNMGVESIDQKTLNAMRRACAHPARRAAVEVVAPRHRF